MEELPGGKHAPLIRAAMVLYTIAPNSWGEIWRAAGIPRLRVGSLSEKGMIVVAVDLRKGTFSTIGHDGSPLRPVERRVLRNVAVQRDCDGPAACLAAAIGNGVVLVTCPVEALSQAKCSSQQWKPVHYAARFGHLRCLQVLAQRALGTFAHADDCGWRPIHLAANEGHTTCLQFIARVAPETVDAQTEMGQTIAHLAACGHDRCLDAIAQVAPQTLSQLTIDNESPAHVAVSDDEFHKCVGICARVAPATFSANSADNWTPVDELLYFQRIRGLRALAETAPGLMP